MRRVVYLFYIVLLNYRKSWEIRRMKRNRTLLFFIFLLFCTGCGKQQSREHGLQAQHYYELAQVELSVVPRDITCYERACAHLEQACMLDNKSVYAVALAGIYTRLGRVEKAESLVRELLAKKLERRLCNELQNTHACVCAMKGERAQAIALWQALSQDPEYATPECALLNMGNMCWRDGDAANARCYFEQALLHNAHLVDAHVALAHIALLDDKEMSRASMHLDAALFLAPQHPQAHALRAQMMS
jgi:Tfp pilus assembly protein PilF